MVDVIKQLQQENLRIDNQELTLEEALKIVTYLMTLVFDCPPDVISGVTPELLNRFPENGKLHETAIARFRTLCMLGQLRALLDTSSLTEFDLILQASKKFGSSGGASAKPNRPTLNQKLINLCRQVQEFADMQRHLQSACASEIEAAMAAEEDLFSIEEKTNQLALELARLQEDMDVDKVKAQLQMTQRDITSEKNALEECGRDLKSTMENLGRLQTQLNQKQRELDNMESKIQHGKNDLDKLQKEIVDDPDKLRREIGEAQSLLDRAEKEAMEAMRQKKAMESLEQAYEKAKECCDKQRVLLEVHRTYTAKARECTDRINRAQEKDALAQKAWLQKVQETQKFEQDYERRERALRAEMDELDKREKAEEKNAKLEADAVREIEEKICQLQKETMRERALEKDAEENYRALDQTEEELRQALCVLRSATKKWETDCVSLPNEVLKMLMAEQDALQRDVGEAISKLRSR